jgi:o-succinylbenzoate synthase
MALQAAISKRIFHFNFDARTSRGSMSNRTSWFIKVWDSGNPKCYGIGECGPLPGLSIDDRADLEEVLNACLQEFTRSSGSYAAIQDSIPPEFPAVRFALETAWLDLSNGGTRTIYVNDFICGRTIPINGLIWMADADHMIRQIEQKIAAGYRTLKLKVGSLDFEQECRVLQYIRERYPSDAITLRLDANGAFHPDHALEKLKQLALHGIHSIEQPVKPGHAVMEELCRTSPIPIALDEEMIGVHASAEMRSLLQRIKPQYIILKPTLHGGLQGCREWISLAESMATGWWMTSALESNIGLNAICQFAANYTITLPQGLGTGQLYHDNIPSPLTVADGKIFCRPEQAWKTDGLFTED